MLFPLHPPITDNNPIFCYVTLKSGFLLKFMLAPYIPSYYNENRERYYIKTILLIIFLPPGKISRWISCR